MRTEDSPAEKEKPVARGRVYHRTEIATIEEAPFCALPADYFEMSLCNTLDEDSRRRVLCTIQRWDGSELLVVDTSRP